MLLLYETPRGRALCTYYAASDLQNLSNCPLMTAAAVDSTPPIFLRALRARPKLSTRPHRLSTPLAVHRPPPTCRLMQMSI